MERGASVEIVGCRTIFGSEAKTTCTASRACASENGLFQAEARCFERLTHDLPRRVDRLGEGEGKPESRIEEGPIGNEFPARRVDRGPVVARERATQEASLPLPARRRDCHKSCLSLEGEFDQGIHRGQCHLRAGYSTQRALPVSIVLPPPNATIHSGPESDVAPRPRARWSRGWEGR